MEGLRRPLAGYGWAEVRRQVPARSLCITVAVKGRSGPAQEKDLHNVEFTPGVGQELGCVARVCCLGFFKESGLWNAPSQLSSTNMGNVGWWMCGGQPVERPVAVRTSGWPSSTKFLIEARPQMF